MCVKSKQVKVTFIKRIFPPHEANSKLIDLEKDFPKNWFGRDPRRVVFRSATILSLLSTGIYDRKTLLIA